MKERPSASSSVRARMAKPAAADASEPTTTKKTLPKKRPATNNLKMGNTDNTPKPKPKMSRGKSRVELTGDSCDCHGKDEDAEFSDDSSGGGYEKKAYLEQLELHDWNSKFGVEDAHGNEGADSHRNHLGNA